MRKSTKAKWTRVKSGTWTWHGYTAQRVWSEQEYHERTHYWTWVLTYLGTTVGEYAILAQAKAAAAQRDAALRGWSA